MSVGPLASAGVRNRQVVSDHQAFRDAATQQGVTREVSGVIDSYHLPRVGGRVVPVLTKSGGDGGRRRVVLTSARDMGSGRRLLEGVSFTAVSRVVDLMDVCKGRLLDGQQ